MTGAIDRGPRRIKVKRIYDVALAHSVEKSNVHTSTCLAKAGFCASQSRLSISSRSCCPPPPPGPPPPMLWTKAGLWFSLVVKNVARGGHLWYLLQHARYWGADRSEILALQGLSQNHKWSFIQENWTAAETWGPQTANRNFCQCHGVAERTKFLIPPPPLIASDFSKHIDLGTSVVLLSILRVHPWHFKTSFLNLAF